MSKSSLLKRVSVATAVAAALTVTMAQPAFAASSISHHQTQAQADNNPGQGTAWVWVYSGNEANATGGQVEYQLTNGGSGTLAVGHGKSASKDPGGKIKAFRACTNYYIDGYPIKGCSSWAYFS
ncbi:hypothetical protein [Micromonospora chokoriensis]|uniref:hypothetical protein n=1 Tax=Micromonospora chokoriensis TaxID=356851 RepID=UPI0004C3F387|nr:hypothetical protein [Micromonospora chokoriensis]